MSATGIETIQHTQHQAQAGLGVFAHNVMQLCFIERNSLYLRTNLSPILTLVIYHRSRLFRKAAFGSTTC
jgi:hypothetical protein